MNQNHTNEYYDRLDQTGQKTANLADINNEEINEGLNNADDWDLEYTPRETNSGYISQEIIDLFKTKKKKRRGTKGSNPKRKLWRDNNSHKRNLNSLKDIPNLINYINENYDMEEQLKLIVGIFKKILGVDLTFQKKGRLYYALCPFHQENTPSFAFHTGFRMDYGSLHCYGCQKSFGHIVGLAIDLLRAQKRRIGSKNLYVKPEQLSSFIFQLIYELGLKTRELKIFIDEIKIEKLDLIIEDIPPQKS